MRRGILAVVAAAGLASSALAGISTATYTESFNGVAAGTNIGAVPGWYGTAGGGWATVTAGVGVGGSNGLSNGDQGFNWTAHPFTWSAMAAGDKVVMGMDFQASSNGQFDDDRLGWTTQSAGTSSSYHFGAQVDHANGGFVTYWKVGGATKNLKIIDFAGQTFANDGWYRASATYTKLTDTSSRIDVSLQQLDASGNLVGTALTGSLADTSALGGDSTPASYFTGETYPMYKNFSALSGAADNAVFSTVAVPEPASLALVILGACALGARRRLA